MRARLVPLALTAIAAGSLVAMGPAVTLADVDAPTEGCADVAGRELLTFDGFDLEMLPAGATAPELAATNDVTGDVVTPHRTAHFFYTADAAPYEAMDVTVTLTWADTPSDYDMFLLDGAYDYELARSDDTNIESGDTRIETMSAKVDDCQTLDLKVRSWAGNPQQLLSLEITAEPSGDALADTLPRPADARRAMYLGGDRPGNLTTPADTAGAETYPFAATFTEDRPSENVPNVIVRPVAGSTIEKNPVQPWWSGQLDDFPTVTGNPSALVWLSSPTEEHDPGTILVQLFLNGVEHTVEIDGSELTAWPQPFHVEFEPFDELVYAVTFQVSALPIASPNAASEHLGDASHSVWFDSVQYQSRIFLPIGETLD